MTFYKAAKNNGKIYFQNLIKKDTTLGIPVLFSRAPIDGGAFEEAYVLVLKDTSDLWHLCENAGTDKALPQGMDLLRDDGELFGL